MDPSESVLRHNLDYVDTLYRKWLMTFRVKSDRCFIDKFRFKFTNRDFNTINQ